MGTIKHSQRDRVKAHLLAGKTITPMQALILFGSIRLSSIIYDLKKYHGLDIHTEIKRDENNKPYGCYSLIRDEQLPIAV